MSEKIVQLNEEIIKGQLIVTKSLEDGRVGGADKKLDSRRRQLNVHKRAGRNSVKGI